MLNDLLTSPDYYLMFGLDLGTFKSVSGDSTVRTTDIQNSTNSCRNSLK